VILTKPVVVGFLVLPFVAGALPFGGDSAVAALIMKADRCNAGIASMQASSPDGWRGAAAPPTWCGPIRGRLKIRVYADVGIMKSVLAWRRDAHCRVSSRERRSRR
jgi:hypothetical protein